jgi:two-component system sensor histidine kinase RegB
VDPAVSQLGFDTLINDISEDYGDDDTAVRVTANAAMPGTPAPLMRRSPELMQGLGNLIENATEFARSRVELEYSWDAEQVELTISDDGPGFAANILGLLGDPYISTRPDSGRMGLGVFISKTLLERTGAALHFFNRGRGLGATVVIRWPRHIIDLTIVDAVSDGNNLEQ